MPNVRVIFYKEDDGTVPIKDWLGRQSVIAQARLMDRLRKLRSRGHDLRRPLAAPLKDGIYELRVRENKIRLRMLYFFSGRHAVVLSHGLKKETAQVSQTEISRALARKRSFDINPEAHTFYWEPEDD